MANCLFCDVAASSVDADVVAESDNVLAFRDINPQAPTHVLLIPRSHTVDSAADLTEEHGELLGELFSLAARVARDEELSGWRLVTNVGAEAGQSVHHLHVHLLGGRSLGWPPG